MAQAEHRIGGAGVEGVPSLGRERRRQARVYARWCELRPQGRWPARGDFYAAQAEAGEASRFFAVPQAGRDHVSDCSEALAAALLYNQPLLRDDAAPTSFRFASIGEARQGLLLPLASADARLVGFAVVDAALQVVADGPAVLAGGAGSAAVALNPWASPASNAAALLGRSRAPALPFGTRLAAARTWVALATQGPLPTRASGLHAALCAAFDLVLRADNDLPAWQALGLVAEAQDASTRVARALFAQPEAIALALSHGCRLGLDVEGFGAAIAAAGGHDRLAADEQGLRTGTRPTEPGAELVLSPVDHAFLVRLARRDPFRQAESFGARAAA